LNSPTQPTSGGPAGIVSGSGTVEQSDDQLDRLLYCMGYRLEVTRRPVVPELTRFERRSWRFHSGWYLDKEDLCIRKSLPKVAEQGV
jgi:hypothetical protein